MDNYISCQTFPEVILITGKEFKVTSELITFPEQP